MDSEELQLLRENNMLLKQILFYLQNNHTSLATQFVIDYMANKAAQK